MLYAQLERERNDGSAPDSELPFPDFDVEKAVACDEHLEKTMGALTEAELRSHFTRTRRREMTQEEVDALLVASPPRLAPGAEEPMEGGTR